MQAHIFYYPWYGTPERDGAYYHWNHEVALLLYFFFCHILTVIFFVFFVFLYRF